MWDYKVMKFIFYMVRELVLMGFFKKIFKKGFGEKVI